MNGVLYLLLLAFAFGIVEVQCAPCDSDKAGRSANDEEPDERIIGGKIDKEFRFKYAVAIFFILNATQAKFQCTSSIIGPRTILTAAHCVISNGTRLEPKTLVGKVGSAEFTLGRHIKFIELIPHPRYKAYDVFSRDDIAILKTAENILTGDDVMQVCIASRRTELDQYKYATAMGWGLTNKDLSNSQSSDYLKYVELELNSHEFCKMRQNVDEKQICADGYGQGTCYGDSGGPLSVVDNKGKKDIVIGLTSFAEDNRCASMFVKPTVFTRVAAYEEWILKNAGEDAKNMCVMSKPEK